MVPSASSFVKTHEVLCLSVVILGASRDICALLVHGGLAGAPSSVQNCEKFIPCYLLPTTAEGMCPRIKIHPRTTKHACGNCVWATFAVMDTCAGGKSSMIITPRGNLLFVCSLFSEMLFLFSLHPSLCWWCHERIQLSSDGRTEPTEELLCWEAPGKARPRVATERLAEVPGADVIFGVSVLVSSFFRCEVSLFDSPSITLGDTINKSVHASPLSLKKEKLQLLTIIIEN